MGKRIKILQLTTDSKIAGTEKLLLSLADKYDKGKFEMVFCTFAREGCFHEEMKRMHHQALSLTDQNLSGYLFILSKLISLLRKNKFDIIHTHLFHASLLGQIVARIPPGSRTILTRHYSDFMWVYGGVVKRNLDRLSAILADRIIAVSNAVRDTLINTEHIDPNKIVRVYNGIDLESIGKVKKDNFFCNKHIRLGCIGTLHPCKGHKFLLEAVAQLRDEFKNIELIIVGDGILRNYLERICAQLGIGDIVSFLGFQSNVFDSLGNMDIVIQPSVKEGFGITLLEAMAMERPVVASSVDGIPEIVVNNETGILVPPQDSDAIAKAIRYLIKNPNIAVAMGKRGRKRVEDHFTIDKMISEYSSLYEAMTGA